MIKSWVPIIRSEKNILPKTINTLNHRFVENKKPKIDIDSTGVKFGPWGINLETVKKKIDNPKVLAAFKAVQDSPNQFEKITVNLNV